MKIHDARTLSADALYDLRTRVVAAVREGMSQSQAARVFAVHRSAVNRWCRVTDLNGPRPGRRPTGGPLDPDQTAELLDAIRTRHPDDLGLVDACGAAMRSPSTRPGGSGPAGPGGRGAGGSAGTGPRPNGRPGRRISRTRPT